LHRDISFSNLLLTRRTSTEHAVGLLIDFDYAQHLKSNKEASDKTGNSSLSALNTHVADESSGVLIPSPNVTASVESSGGSIPPLSSSTRAAEGPQEALIPDNDVGKPTAKNLRTVSLIFLDG
jgi:hypothetical protein